MIVRVTEQSVELRASTCVRTISLCSSVRIPLTDTLDSLCLNPKQLDDVCHIESHFGLLGDSVSFGAR